MSRFTRRAVSVVMAAAMRVMSPAAPSVASSAPEVEPEQVDATGRRPLVTARAEPAGAQPHHEGTREVLKKRCPCAD
jgi:hypothetical protein